MFDELTEELLDLQAERPRLRSRGVRGATRTRSSCGTIVLCCTCTTLCW